ncbi:MAG: phosphoesterase [Frankiales bacterium]|nr:phosphoesterase [Frankiales bacterium]
MLSPSTGHSDGMRRALVLLLLVTACSSTSTSPPAQSPSATTSLSAAPTATATRPPAAQGISKVLTIVEENHGTQSARAGMPYLASLADQYGVATDYRSLTHPSLPNYLAMAAGSTFGISDDDGPSAHPVSGPSVFDLALQRGHTATVYAESMPSPCHPSSGGRYAARHNTWTYFPASSQCAGHDVSADGFSADVTAGRLPDVGLLVPDLCHDAHDCSLATADSYLQDVMRTVLAGPDWQAGRLAVVVTFDEVEGDESGTLLTVVVAPALEHARIGVPLSHLSWCRWMTDLVGAPPLRDAARARSLGDAFGL